MAQRSWAGAAVPTTLVAGISGSDPSFSITSASGWPTGGATAFIAVIDRGEATEEKIVVTSRSGVVLTVGTRGHDGTSAVAHDLGATIEHCLDAESLTRFDRHVEDSSRDDHTQYQKESEKGTASGYASLDGSGLVPLAQIPQLTASQLAADSVGSSEIAANAVGTVEVVDAAITMAKLADLAQALIFGRAAAAGTGVPKGLTAAEVKTILALASTDVSDFTEAVQDVMGAILLDSANIDWTYTDASNLHSAVVKLASLTQAEMATGLRVPVVCTSGTRPGSPVEGDHIYETDTDRMLIYTTATTGWRQPWNMPWGVLTNDGSPTGSTTLAAGVASETVAVTSSAVTIPANRKTRVQAYALIEGSGAAAAEFRLRRGTTTGGTLLAGPMKQNIADIIGSRAPVALQVIDTGASGSTQYVLTSNTGDIKQPTFISVEDVGPNGAPA